MFRCLIKMMAVCSMLLHFGFLKQVAQAAASDGDLCRAAAAMASVKTGVPLRVLLALTLTETGRETPAGFLPWPWTLNLSGEGQWLADRDDTLEMLEAALAGGMQNIDIGCFQLNHHWHAAGFASLADMLDPELNASYAARLLAGLYEKTGAWDTAAAAYHSRTPEHAERYLGRYRPIYAALGESPGQPAATVPRNNSFPLLQSGGRGELGSLFAGHQALRPLIGG